MWPSNVDGIYEFRTGFTKNFSVAGKHLLRNRSAILSQILVYLFKYGMYLFIFRYTLIEISLTIKVTLTFSL